MEIGSSDIRVHPVTDEQLHKFSLFDEVDLKPLRPHIDRCIRLKLNANEILLSPLWGNRKMYLLLKGKVSVHLDSANAKVLLELGEGECLGEMSVFDGDNPSAFVKTLSDCEVLVIDRTILWQMIDVSHDFCRNLLSFLSSRLRSGNSIVATSRHNEEEQQEAANKDALTGVHNRRWLDNTLNGLQGWQLYSCLPITILIVDVDHFKRINDNFGHLAGDLVLQMIAQSIQKCLRPQDSIARYGGEEFVVLLPKTPLNHGLKIAERVRRAIASRHVTVHQGQEIPAVTVSVGAALVDGSKPVDRVFDAADKALFSAKRKGRNCIETS